ncbi:hypothetical protein FRC02_011420 [Tulasnella sp. 418]|nr:hypothetical protein FRC02_011420 [Tulasnella sp. 418]
MEDAVKSSDLDLSGKYVKNSRKGRGPSSDIWYGMLHTSAGEVQIAIKELQVQRNSNFSFNSIILKKRCLKEVEKLAQMKHINIVPLFGFAVDSQGIPALISPWYEHGNVVEYLEMHSNTNRISLALDIGEGLKYLHSKSVIHGDIKGENVLVNADGRASLCDIGVSQFIEDALFVTGLTTSQGNAGGSDRFLAPEILQDLPKTVFTDIWAFGCLVAQILTGRVPYDGILRKFAIYTAITSGTVPMDNRDEKINQILWECLLKCWSRNPNDRPSIVEVCSCLAGAELSLETLGDMVHQDQGDMSKLDLTGKIDMGQQCSGGGYSEVWRGKLRTDTSVIEVPLSYF